MLIVKENETRNPFEVMFILGSLVTSVSMLTTLWASQVGQKTPPWMIAFLGLGLMLGSFISIIGLSKDTLVGSIIQRSGYGIIAIVFVTYSLLLLTIAGFRAATTAIFLLSMAFGCGWRIVQLTKTLKVVRHVLDDRN